ncbi:DNA fragmentation factor subunit beta isoform X4 [Tyto alba]|uniref:DNA fragmentation factor subunit beta isoform X4 n=1 Tax=Tyto alba TaxID=56313 RepID=UPI001C671E0B|nr:DNA fragmentation factor subunit beta isoform X4 [Tyto alba]
MSEPLRAFRLRGCGSPQKFGVAAGSLRGLLRKGCRLLQLPLPGSRLCLYEDGTELTESYFRALPPQTELVLLGPGESWGGCECAGGGGGCLRLSGAASPAAGVSDLERFLAALSAQRDAVVAAARKLLSDERAPRRQKLLADLLHNLSENILAEHREEDEKWFEGLESRFKNKSSYMRYSCESRIRSYMKEVSSSISNVHPTAKDAYKRIIDLMSDKLKSVKYNGCYFDRREEEAVRLCTTEGWFSCQGPFDRDDCPCKHSINPYSNRESRILFSTWNLDHVIEKKRAVVPELAEAVKTRGGREVNWEYFYQLLFTVDNLKLVHIACHKKTNHNLSCDKTKIYRKKKQNHKIS